MKRQGRRDNNKLTCLCIRGMRGNEIRGQGWWGKGLSEGFGCWCRLSGRCRWHSQRWPWLAAGGGRGAAATCPPAESTQNHPGFHTLPPGLRHEPQLAGLRRRPRHQLAAPPCIVLLPVPMQAKAQRTGLVIGLADLRACSGDHAGRIGVIVLNQRPPAGALLGCIHDGLRARSECIAIHHVLKALYLGYDVEAATCVSCE